MSPPPPHHPHPSPQAGRPVTALDAADVLLVLIVSIGGTRLLGALLGAFLEPAVAGASEPPLLLVLFALALQSLVFVAAVQVIAVRRRGVGWAALGLRRGRRPWVGRAVLAGVLGLALTSAVNIVIAGLAEEPPSNPQQELLSGIGVSWSAFAGMLLLACVVAPLAEELVFRGLLYAWLRARWGRFPAALASALCFAMLHGIVWLIPALTLLGLILAWVYEDSDCLPAAVTTHGLNNTIALVVMYVALTADLPA